jgi:predicted nucleic acid-binding protein
MTQNGVIRVVGNPRFPNSPGSPYAAAQSLESLMALPGHQFWPDEISLLDRTKIDISRMLNSSQVTNSYLLALAIAKGGALATFDRKLILGAVVGGAAGVHQIR